MFAFETPWQCVLTMAIGGLAVGQVVTIWGCCTYYVARWLGQEARP